MACSTVTGTGLGSADTKNKASEHLTLGVSHLIGPRVVAAGSATLSGGTVTIVLPALAGATADYVVTATDKTAAQAVGAALTVATTGSTLVLTGNGTDVIQYSVIKVGVA